MRSDLWDLALFFLVFIEAFNTELNATVFILTSNILFETFISNEKLSKKLETKSNYHLYFYLKCKTIYY